MLKSYEIKISGHVQNVSFRYSTQKIAHNFGINGTVQNVPDGSVFIHAEGEEKDIERLVDWCRHGPDRARVNKVELRAVELQNYSDFAVIT